MTIRLWMSPLLISMPLLSLAQALPPAPPPPLGGDGFSTAPVVSGTITPAARPAGVAAALPAAVESAKLAVGMIRADTRIGSMAGTGFVMEIGQSIYFVTNQHVVAGAKAISVVMYNGKHLKFDVSKGEASPTQDLIRFPMDAEQLAGCGNRLRRGNIPTVGTKAYALGNSSGYKTLDVFPGEVIRVGGHDVEVSCDIVHGCSGGPIVDQAGGLIGVSTYMRVIETRKVVNESQSPADGPGTSASGPGGVGSGVAATPAPAREIRKYGMVLSNGTEWSIAGPEFVAQSYLLYDLNTACEQLISYAEAEDNAQLWIEDYKFNKRFELISDPDMRLGMVTFLKNEELSLNRLSRIVIQYGSLSAVNTNRGAREDFQKVVGYQKLGIGGIVSMTNVARDRHRRTTWSSEYLKSESEQAMESLSMMRAELSVRVNHLSDLDRKLKMKQPPPPQPQPQPQFVQ